MRTHLYFIVVLALAALSAVHGNQAGGFSLRFVLLGMRQYKLTKAEVAAISIHEYCLQVTTL